MKKIAVLIVIFGFTKKSISQTNCGILQAYDYVYRQDPSAKQRVADLIKATDSQGNVQAKPSSVVNYTIPVVFHVLHLGGPENISDAQIMDQIDIMNIDYAKQNGDTINAVSQFQGLIGTAGVVFQLANKDENGNCTTGITRHYDANTNWNVDFNNYIYTWNPSKYLNVYVVKYLIAGSAAYSFYPGTVPAAADAIVVRHDYVGSIGTGVPYTSRTLTHEAGHWMNLQHPWGSTNQPGVACGDDGVSDTPITKGFTFCNLANAINCTPGVTENVQNFMDYSYCAIMFTPGQCTRMHTALNSTTAGRNNVWSTSNLIATGITNPIANCPPTADFVAEHSLSCVGNTIHFLDESYNTPPTSWRWSSPLASTVSNLQNGVLTFTGSGATSVKLKVGNSYGSDSIVQQNILVLAGQGSGSINVAQGFETDPIPDNQWLVSTPQYGSSFQRTDTAQHSGAYCAWINNFYDNPNGPVSLFSPAFNLQFATTSQLTFYYAYSQKTAADNDQLNVYASGDCGLTWTSLFSSSGSLLSTTGAPQASPYLFPASNEWQQLTVDALSFCGQPRVYFKFEFTPDTAGSGNNFLIDDINLDATFVINVGIKTANAFKSLQISPNPFTNVILVTGENVEDITGFQLSDISGRVLLKEDRLLIKNKNLRIEQLDNLLQGIYFIKLDGQQGSRLFKIIKD